MIPGKKFKGIARKIINTHKYVFCYVLYGDFVLKQLKNIVIFFMCLTIVWTSTLDATVDAEPYVESYQLSITCCNFLEHIQEFTNQSLLIKISSTALSSPMEIHSSKRFLTEEHTVVLQPVEDRYISVYFEVYEISDKSYILCDLNEEPGIGSAEIIFDTYTGKWTGDDFLKDKSGYGRLNGCDDESYDVYEYDVELRFTIEVIDQDGDGIPRWFEEHVYGSDPFADDADRDDDMDGVPLFWEYCWEYDPFTFDDHVLLDPDNDGLSNHEEYLVCIWGSDPFRKDMFMELDQMQIGPNNEGSFVPESSLIRVAQTYAKRNIVFHVDDGCMGGGDILPYEPVLWMGKGRTYYQRYFLQNDSDHWRRGVFRYALFVYNHLPIRGMEFPAEHSILLYFIPGLNSFVISTLILDRVSIPSDEACAFIILHELGHTLGMCMGRPMGCDNQLMRFPFSLQNILFKNYKSVMNYKYAYSILDYSDGSHGIGDFNDWGYLDLTYFQPKGAL